MNIIPGIIGENTSVLDLIRPFALIPIPNLNTDLNFN
jgi:hypothetical protein